MYMMNVYIQSYVIFNVMLSVSFQRKEICSTDAFSVYIQRSIVRSTYVCDVDEALTVYSLLVGGKWLHKFAKAKLMAR